MKKLAVVGSINMDVVTRVERFPQPGETLTGTSFSTIPGGKGANQAVALGRLGMPVRMAGCVGDDAFGESYLRNFAENGVDTSLVRVRKGQTTGTATIEVNAEGENHIVRGARRQRRMRHGMAGGRVARPGRQRHLPFAA